MDRVSESLWGHRDGNGAALVYPRSGKVSTGVMNGDICVESGRESERESLR
jgi:hypothetical protein